jgi:hypothetical protein
MVRRTLPPQRWRVAHPGRGVALGLCLLCHTAAASVGVVGSLTHEITALPGRSYQGAFELRNSGTVPEQVKIYQTDYFYTSDAPVYGEPGQLPRSNARWIAFSPAQITVPAGEAVPVNYSIQVPDDTTLRGTYWSMLMVEPIAPGSPESASADAGRVVLQIRQVFRYGLLVITDVAPQEARREVRFSALKLAAREGRPVLDVDVESTGDRGLSGELWVELYSDDGGYVGKFAGGKKRLLPGTSVRYAVDLSGLGRRTYKALLVLDSGGDDVFGADVTLVLQ